MQVRIGPGRSGASAGRWASGFVKPGFARTGPRTRPDASRSKISSTDWSSSAPRDPRSDQGCPIPCAARECWHACARRAEHPSYKNNIFPFPNRVACPTKGRVPWTSSFKHLAFLALTPSTGCLRARPLSQSSSSSPGERATGIDGIAHRTTGTNTVIQSQATFDVSRGHVRRLNLPKPLRESGSYFSLILFGILRCRERTTRAQKATSARSSSPFGIAESVRCP